MNGYRWKSALVFVAVLQCVTASVEAATIYVAKGADLQKALNAAQPGDTILLEPNAEFGGNFSRAEQFHRQPGRVGRTGCEPRFSFC